MMMKMRRRGVRTASIALAVTGALALAACGSDDNADNDAPTTTAAPAGTTVAPAGGSITIGSADFPESQLIAEIYGQALEKKGFTFQHKAAIGSREIYYKAIADGEIDLVPEYTNSLLSFVIRQGDPKGAPTAKNVTEQVAELGTVLPANLQVLTPSAAEDKDVIVCSKAVADQYALKTLSDLAKVADKITLGAPAEFETRSPFGLVGLKDIYGAEFKEFVPLAFNDIATTIKDGGVDCGNLFSTMSVITTSGFVALTDDKVIVPNEAVVPLIAKDTATPDVVAVLDAVSKSLDTDQLKAMMVKIEVDKAAPDVVAKEFVATLTL